VIAEIDLAFDVPSIVRSSLPFNSPLITTDFPMFTTSLSFWPSPRCLDGLPVLQEPLQTHRW
jgi:hypothetical protein